MLTIWNQDASSRNIKDFPARLLDVTKSRSHDFCYVIPKPTDVYLRACSCALYMTRVPLCEDHFSTSSIAMHNFRVYNIFSQLTYYPWIIFFVSDCKISLQFSDARIIGQSIRAGYHFYYYFILVEARSSQRSIMCSRVSNSWIQTFLHGYILKFPALRSFPFLIFHVVHIVCEKLISGA